MNLLQASVNSAAAVASTWNQTAQVPAPLAQMIRTVEARINVEAGSARDTIEKDEAGIADSKHNERVADLLLPSCTVQDAKDRGGTIEIFRALFPTCLSSIQEAMVRLSANASARLQAETAVAQVEGIGGDAFLKDLESKGLEALAGGDATAARSHVTKAYAACPTVKSVERIRQKLDIVNANGPDSVNRIICRHVKERSRRMPAEIQARLEQHVDQPCGSAKPNRDGSSN